jgi:GNAT superfamily N-acetyltransferase
MSGAPSTWVAQPDEAETVARLLVAFRDHLGRDWPSENAFLAGVERLIERPDTEFLLGAVHEDAPPTGVTQLRFRHGLWWAATDCLVEDLFVAEEARGAGLGRALLDLAIARARARGCRRVELDTTRDNEAALGLYRSVGFDDKGGEAVFMRLHLEDAP